VSRQRWEYAKVVWVSKARKIYKHDPEFERLSPEVQKEWQTQSWSYYWWLSHIYEIWLPGAEEVDERLAWETTDEDHRFGFLDICNELGADGWEAVSSEVRNSAMGPRYGRDTTSFPIRTQTLFKRPVSD
jgi:hypothetical protein